MDVRKTESGWTDEQAKKIAEATDQSVRESGASTARATDTGTSPRAARDDSPGRRERATAEPHGATARTDDAPRGDEGSEERADEAGADATWAAAARERNAKTPTNRG